MLEQKKRLLLYRLRKEMNGAALDTMRYFGADYERNYGVQIYAIRNLAREIGTDHALAEYFYTQNIREAQLVALWIADAEQASHALLSRIEPISILLCEWCASESALLAYCALLSAARSGRVEESIAVESILLAVAKFADNRLVAQGATALAMNLSDNGVKELISQLPDNPTASLLREEIAWRIEC